MVLFSYLYLPCCLCRHLRHNNFPQVLRFFEIWKSKPVGKLFKLAQNIKLLEQLCGPNKQTKGKKKNHQWFLYQKKSSLSSDERPQERYKNLKICFISWAFPDRPRQAGHTLFCVLFMFIKQRTTGNSSACAQCSCFVALVFARH